MPKYRGVLTVHTVSTHEFFADDWNKAHDYIDDYDWTFSESETEDEDIYIEEVTEGEDI